MTADPERGPHTISGKWVLLALLLLAIAASALIFVLVGDDFDPTAKPVDSPISDRELLPEE